ncbi:MAG TPA: aldehyde dehydrogenase family protein [Chitinophagales bacterium]|nr:aldehyde dehydrogenase family protein [Chitinophagales bacterium]HLP50437.1 aldehyde dehydrogenase family protein [Chitinophagales bacterium]
METATATAVKNIPISPNTKLEEIFRIYDAQFKNRQNLKNSTAKQRKEKLKKMIATVNEMRSKIEDAVYADLRKPKVETAYAEIYNTVSECKHAIANLDDWMAPQEVDTPIMYVGSSSKIVSEPKGMALLLTPWNYPFQMPAQHLVAAVAAGCSVIIKPSEFTPHTSAVVKEFIGKVFTENEVAVIEGDHTVSTELLKLKFDHIHFTGSPAVGKVVMHAAADHLTSVTLELGGKSPVIIDETANIDAAVKKITWGKLINCGQTCIAPDYVLVHESKKDEFITKLIANIKKVFGENPQQSKDISHIINNRHFNRLKNVLNDAISKGAKVELGGQLDESDNYIAPTILSNVSLNSKVMEEEIFGPLLPVIGYKTENEVLNLINGKEKPLALYIFSAKGSKQDFWLNNTSAGGTCINDNLVHISQPNLPFGGVNNSGIGKSFGHFGFKEFSNERAVLKALHSGSVVTPLWQPYGKLAQTVTDFMIKFF